MSEENVQTRKRIGTSYAMYRLAEEHRGAVVQRALEREKALTPETARLLRSFVAGARLPGFRPGKAPLSRYADLFLEFVRGHDRMAAAILRAWRESEDGLVERVRAFLVGRGMLEGDGEEFDDEITTFRRTPEWETAMTDLAQQHPEDSEEALHLMACLVVGALDIDETDDEEIGPAPEDAIPEAFLPMLRALGQEPPSSPMWEFATDVFPEVLRELRKQSEEAFTDVVQLADAEREIIEQHADLLRYFGSDLEDQADGSRLLWSDVKAAAAAIRKLHELLDGYATVREPAAVRNEEAARRTRRETLEAEIDAALAGLQALEAPPELTDALPDDAEEPEASPEEMQALRAEASELQHRVEALESERDLIAGERGALRIERDALASECDALAEQVQSLEDDIEESRTLAETWRIFYQASQQSRTEEDVPFRPVAENVEHAAVLAEDRFPEQLTFSLNTKSDVTIPFDKPQQVYDALEWLATGYYSARCGESSVPDLDFSLKQVCGWRYTPVQSERTMGQFPEYYETTVDGRKRKLEEHIGTGNGYHRGTIRIAFLWDADRKRVIVGYIGRHQRTRAT